MLCLFIFIFMQDLNKKQIWNADFFFLNECTKSKNGKWSWGMNANTIWYFFFKFSWIKCKKLLLFCFSFPKNNNNAKPFFFWFIIGKTNANKMNDARIELTWFRSLSSDTKCYRLEIRVGKMDDGSLDGSTKEMIGWAIWWNASYEPENKCKKKWDMISNMIKQDK